MTEIGLYEAMSSTRAVRRLRPDPIPDDVLRRVFEAANWAPTGGNAQPWRVIAVKDPAKRQALQALYLPEWEAFAARYRGGLDTASPAVRQQRERQVRAADHLARTLHLVPVILVFCFNPTLMAITDAECGRPSVVGGASVYPSVQNALLACRAEGLGATLTTLLCRREPEVKALLDVPADWYTCAFLPIGYPEGPGHGPLTRRPVERMAYLDAWGAPLFVADP